MMHGRAFVAFACLAASAAFAQPINTPAGPWPTKPVKIMVGASPGGGTNPTTTARASW